MGIVFAAMATVSAQPPFPRDDDGAMMPPPPRGGHGWHKGKGFGKHLKELNLTSEQQQKIDAQRKEQRSVMKGLRESLKAKHDELRAEMDKENTDKAKAESIGAELKKLEGQRIDQEIKGILQMKETLTPEQFKKLGDMREKREGGRGGKHGRKGKGHGRDDAGECTPATPVAAPQSTPEAE
jgi:Spy/CpxP family protein refolding chaperone